jgi:hypothetical protein
MIQEVLESINATIQLNLYFNDALILNTKGQYAGFENTFE